jgi:hypothetical protein
MFNCTSRRWGFSKSSFRHITRASRRVPHMSRPDRRFPATPLFPYFLRIKLRHQIQRHTSNLGPLRGHYDTAPRGAGNAWNPWMVLGRLRARLVQLLGSTNGHSGLVITIAFGEGERGRVGYPRLARRRLHRHLPSGLTEQVVKHSRRTGAGAHGTDRNRHPACYDPAHTPRTAEAQGTPAIGVTSGTTLLRDRDPADYRYPDWLYRTCRVILSASQNFGRTRSGSL